MLVEPRAMTEDELIDEIARAMFPTAWDADHDDPQDDGQVSKKYARFKARAALAAIRKAGCEVAPREPTEKMLAAAEDPLCGVACGDVALDIAGDAWHAMLSASPLKGET